MRRTVAIAAAAAALAVPAVARAAPTITASCNGGACSTGWYNVNVTVTFTIAGGTIVSGCQPVTIDTDSPGTPLSSQPRCEAIPEGSTQSTTLYVPIKRDATAPTVASMALTRGPDVNGWYNHPVDVATTGTDNLSGIASCTNPTYSGSDSTSGTISATCTDNAGNVSPSKSLTLQYDATPPSVSPSAARGPDANGWYNHGVSVSFTGSDAVSGIDSCTSGSYAGPDTGSAAVSGSCKDKAGNSAGASYGLKYDATPPSVSGASPDRPPDANGWYNHALAVAFAGTDATSGIASCDTVKYDKPTDASASVSGRCTDNAGNTSPVSPFAFKFDSTPPKLTDVAVSAVDKAVTLTWKASADVAALKITRTGGGAPLTVYDGKRVTTFTDKKVKNGARYSYVVTALDDAGNPAILKDTATPSAALLAPRAQARVHGGPTLRWQRAKDASYYNVQLWLDGKKFLTTWPAVPRLALRNLKPGRYTWLVWPGLGDRTKHRYGPLIGKSTFVVTG